MKDKSLKNLLEQIQIYLLESNDESKKLKDELDELLDESELKKAAKAAKKNQKAPVARHVPQWSKQA